jgi:hypothetical protein
MMICMNRNNVIFAIAVFSLLVTITFLPLNIRAGGETYTDKKAKWTFIVYLDADNDLESAGIRDLNEMEKVGSSGDVNIVVLMDRAIGEDTSNGDWTDARIFYVTKDDDPQTINSITIEKKGELNMGDPNTLINFTNWAIDKYPADKYIIDIWDHGGGFAGAAWDDGDPNTAADDDWLNLDNISFAVQNIKSHLGRNIDIVAFDACLMGEVSVMYTLYGYTDVAIGSGPVEPGDGWPYERILKSLVETPTMSPVDLAKEIVTDYIESYSDLKGDPTDYPKVTMAAWHMNRMMPVFSAVNSLGMAMAMKSGLPPDGMILRLYAARDRTHSYDMMAIGGINLEVYYPMYDAYELAGQLLADPTIRDNYITESAKEVRSTIEDANIISSAGFIAEFKDIYSLSVYFPTGERAVPGMKIGPASPYSLRYDTTQWAREQYWDDFLKNYWVPHISADDTPPAIYVDGDLSNKIENGAYKTIHGTAYDFQGDVKVFISIDNQSWQDITEQKGNNIEWKYMIKYDGGAHTMKIKAVDSSGKESVVISRQIAGEVATPTKVQPAPNTTLPLAIAIIFVLVLAVIYTYRKHNRKRVT